jgi:hypothetical protein
MEKQILEIVKQKDDWKYTVEIKDNSKGEPAVTVKTRSDATAQEAGDLAIKEYNRIKSELSPKIETEKKPTD